MAEMRYFYFKLKRITNIMPGFILEYSIQKINLFLISLFKKQC